MSSTQRKKDLFHNIVKLRRAERESPDSREIVAVRGWLEADLGPTLSRRLAAELLGVTHTALARWIKAGDLPVVQPPRGRAEVPVAALLDLYEAVQEERNAGGRRRHVLEPSMAAGRMLARALRFDDLPQQEHGGHDRADRRNLAYHKAVARRLRRPMVDDARHLVWRWRDEGKLDPRYADAWEDVLSRRIPEIRKAMTAETPVGRDLRQNSPFAGALSEAERRRILEAVR